MCLALSGISQHHRQGDLLNVNIHPLRLVLLGGNSPASSQQCRYSFIIESWELEETLKII